MKILVTALASSGLQQDPAAEAVRALPIVLDSAFIVRQSVPADYMKSTKTVVEALREHEPEAVICIGQAGGRYAVMPEFVAINFVHAEKPDLAGNQPQNGTIMPDGPDAYFSNLPVFTIVQAIRARGVPAEISYTAGTTLCNSLMYGVAHYLRQSAKQALFGFVHIPYLPSQTVSLPYSAPSLCQDDINAAIHAAVSIVAKQLSVK